MGWGTDFKTKITVKVKKWLPKLLFTGDVYLNRLIFRQKWEVEEKITELQREIAESYEILLMLVAVDTQNLREKDEDLIYSIRNRVSEHVEIIQEAQSKLTLLQLYLHHIEENGISVETHDQ